MAKIKDVVCGMMVDSETTELKSEYEGATYYFCGPGCKTAFDRNPGKYLRQEGERGGHEHRGHGGR